MHLLRGLQAWHADFVVKIADMACRTRSHYEHHNTALLLARASRYFMCGNEMWLQGLTRGMSVLGEASMGEELALSLL